MYASDDKSVINGGLTVATSVSIWLCMVFILCSIWLFDLNILHLDMVSVLNGFMISAGLRRPNWANFQALPLADLTHQLQLLASTVDMLSFVRALMSENGWSRVWSSVLWGNLGHWEPGYWKSSTETEGSVGSHWDWVYAQRRASVMTKCA